MTSRSPTKIISGSPNKGVLWFSNWTEHILFTLCIAKVEKNITPWRTWSRVSPGLEKVKRLIIEAWSLIWFQIQLKFGDWVQNSENDEGSDLMYNWVAQRPDFKSALRVVKMVLNTQCYQYLWLTMWFHAKKLKETLKNSKSLILQCKFGSRAQKWPKIVKKTDH